MQNHFVYFAFIWIVKQKKWQTQKSATFNFFVFGISPYGFFTFTVNESLFSLTPVTSATTVTYMESLLDDGTL